jgi:hypothetical protein
VHSEGTPPSPGRRPAGYGERAETYLRLLAEAALRPAGDGDTGRLRRAADALVEARALTEQTAAEILTDFQLALRLRGRQTLFAPAARLQRLAGFRPPSAPGQAAGTGAPWRVLPAGSPTPGSRLMALILTGDRALAPMTIYFPAGANQPGFPPAAGLPGGGAPPLTTLAATDNLGTRYRLGFTDSTWAGSTWTGTVIFRPAPPPAARRLEIIGPNGRLLRVEITADPAGGTAPGAAVRPVAESPGERLLTRRAEAMLAALAHGDRNVHGLGQSALAELAGMLEAAGLLSPLSPAPARLAALGQLIGLPTKGPASEVPARWTSVVAHYGRRRRLPPVTGTAAIGALLPEIDGARLAIAGVRSGGAGTFLHVVVRGIPPLRRRLPRTSWDGDHSWWARDDAGGWHLGAIEDVSPVGGADTLLRLALLPPLARATAAATVEITGITQRVTADLPVRW